MAQPSGMASWLELLATVGVKFALVVTPTVIFFYRTVRVVPFIDRAIIVLPPLAQPTACNRGLGGRFLGFRERSQRFRGRRDLSAGMCRLVAVALPHLRLSPLIIKGQ